MILPFLSVIIAAMCLTLAMTLVLELDMMPADVPFALRLGTNVTFAGFYILFGNFIQKIYRPRVTWAKVALVGLGIIILGAFIASVNDPSGTGHPVTGTPLTKWVFLAGTQIVWAWGMIESFTMWRAYSADLARGKNLDPLIVNRFFLWGVGYVAMLAAGTFMVGFETERTAADQPLWAWFGTAISFVAGSFCIYLSWTPPGWYRKRFEVADVEDAV